MAARRRAQVTVPEVGADPASTHGDPTAGTWGVVAGGPRKARPCPPEGRGDRFTDGDGRCRRPRPPDPSRPSARPGRTPPSSPRGPGLRRARRHGAPRRQGPFYSAGEGERSTTTAREPLLQIICKAPGRSGSPSASSTDNLPKAPGRPGHGPAGRALPAATAQSRDASVLLFLFHQNGCGGAQPRPPSLAPGAPHDWLAPEAAQADWAA